MREEAPNPPTEAHWDYVEGVQGVVLVTRKEGVPQAIIELCPRAGFRLTDCLTGTVGTFLSVEEAESAYETSLSRSATQKATVRS
jgi:hypothetical protein